MPSTIPYDPSLVLTSVVEQKMLDNLTAIANAQKPTDIAQDALNDLLAMKRSIMMTKAELAQLDIDTKPMDDAIKDLDLSIPQAAATYVKAKLQTNTDTKPLKQAQSAMVNSQVESPVDYVKSAIKSMPLAADTLNMDVQYFSVESNDQQGTAIAKKVAGFVSGSMSVLGDDIAVSASSSAASQMAQQYSNHNVAGTLVLAVTCTHKNATVLAPFILNVDKAIQTWNHLFPDAADRLDPTNGASIVALGKQPPASPEKKFSIISGMTYGSSFVGMVHVLKTDVTQTYEQLSTSISQLQVQMDAGSWFEKSSGGFGVNSAFSNQVKSILSTQNITSHVTLISMGVIPSLVANAVKMGVEQFDKFDPQSSMEQIAAIQNATSSDQNSMQASADAARTGQQMIDLKSGTITAALSTLTETDNTANKILDINSMMTALDDYLKKASEGTSGVPINFYIKDITKLMLAEMWVAKYYPGKYMAIISDDSTPPAGGGGNTSNNGSNTGNSGGPNS